jgi:hypothetical protein
MKSLEFFQLWFDKKHIQHLYEFAHPFHNELVTPYFENAIIAEVVPKCNADLIGIASWQLRKKRMSLPAYRQLQSCTGTFLTTEKLINSSFDVAVLLPMPIGHQMLKTAALSFGEIWNTAFEDMVSFLHGQLRMSVPDEVALPVYGNHFVAQREIYKSCVSECLSPVIRYMDARRDIFLKDSGYAITKAKNSGIDEVQRYKERSGRNDWPIAPFLLETLFSLWIEGKQLSIIAI